MIALHVKSNHNLNIFFASCLISDIIYAEFFYETCTLAIQSRTSLKQSFENLPLTIFSFCCVTMFESPDNL